MAGLTIKLLKEIKKTVHLLAVRERGLEVGRAAVIAVIAISVLKS